MLTSGGEVFGHAGLKIQRDEKVAPARRHVTASTSSPPSVSVPPLASAQAAFFPTFPVRSLSSGSFPSRSPARAGLPTLPPAGQGRKRAGRRMRNVADQDPDALGGVGKGRGGGVMDRSGTDKRQTTKKIGRETKMATKADLIHLDWTPLLTDSVPRKTENCFFPRPSFHSEYSASCPGGKGAGMYGA